MKWEKLTDEALLSCLVIGEQRGIEGFLRDLEWMFIIETIRERMIDRRWPSTIRDVILQSMQFSCFNDSDPNGKVMWENYSDKSPLFREAHKFVQAQLNGQNGQIAAVVRPNHYLVNPLYYSSRAPDWVVKMEIIYDGGPRGHIFLRG